MISFRFSVEIEIKSFIDKEKLREFNNTKPALQQMLKEPSLGRKHKRKERPIKTTTKQLRKCK